MLDYPNLRRADYCPLCREQKARGLIVCWPCFRAHDMRNGESRVVKLALDCKEAFAAKEAAASREPFRVIVGGRDGT